MGRLGDNRLSEARLGNTSFNSLFRVSEAYINQAFSDSQRKTSFLKTSSTYVSVSEASSSSEFELIRVSETYLKDIETNTKRDKVLPTRKVETFIPSTFEPGVVTGRLGSERLGSFTVGGGTRSGVNDGIGTVSTSFVLKNRGVNSTVSEINQKIERFIQKVRQTDSYISTLQTDIEVIIPVWKVDSVQVPSVIDEVREWDKLTLVFRSSRGKVVDVLRPLNEDAGKLDVLSKGDGGFKSVDRVGGSNTLTLNAPTRRNDVRYQTTYLVSGYDETAIDQVGDKYEVTVELTPEEEKTPQASYSDDTIASNEWEFAFDQATLGIRRVTPDVEKQDKKGVVKANLDLVTEPKETRVLEESLRKLNATNIREVPDGENISEDNSPANSNTVTITPPPGGDTLFEAGDYVVEDYETVWNNDEFYEVNIELVRA